MSALKIWDKGANVWRYLSVLAVGLDGWIDDSAETWTFATASTFTVAGDVTAKYTVGTRIRLVQSGTVKYFVVSANPTVSSGTTTVTITGGSDYTFANAAVTAPAHSYMANPQGYPTWFNYSPTLAGFSSQNATTVATFAITGRMLNVYMRIDGNSNSSTFTFSLPASVAAIEQDQAGFMAESNGNWSQGQAQIGSGSTVTLFPSLTGSFSSSGLKGCRGHFVFVL